MTTTLPTFADVESGGAPDRRRRAPHAGRHLAHASTPGPAPTLFFKCENLQRAGAFKFRGAYNALSRLTADERRRGVVTFSSGNHAQAIALAGQVLDIPRVIVMPSDAPAVKRERHRRVRRRSRALRSRARGSRSHRPSGWRASAASRSSRRTITRTSSPARAPRRAS